MQSSCKISDGCTLSSLSDSGYKFLRSNVTIFNYLNKCIICEGEFTICSKAIIAMTEAKVKCSRNIELDDTEMLSRIQKIHKLT